MLFRITMSAVAILSIASASVSAAESGESVAYRAKDWIVRHFENQSEAKEFVAIGHGLGCEIKQNIHDGDADVQLRCRETRHLECRGHDEAESRAKWLDELGFEAKHED